MKKYFLLVTLLFVNAVYAETPLKPMKKIEVVNACEPLESVCKSFGYQQDENKMDGRGLYSGCVTLITSGFPPSDINVNNISQSDIKACATQIKNKHARK